MSAYDSEPPSVVTREELLRRHRAGDEPVITDNTEVDCRGEAIGPVWWQGKQWAVTEYGLECRDGTYAIPKKGLVDTIRYPTYGGFPEHMGDKTWVEIDDFCTAWLIALTLHGHRLPPEAIRFAIRRRRVK